MIEHERGFRRLSLEAIKSAARIVIRARNLGYLDRNFRLTEKPLKYNARWSATEFPPTGLVYSKTDILDEVEFLFSGAAESMAGNAGLDRDRVSEILETLRKYRPPIAQIADR